MSTEQNPRGFITDYTYHTGAAQNRLHKIIQPPDTPGGTRAEMIYEWNSTTGMLDTITDPVGKETSFTFDSFSRLVQEIYPDGSKSRILYGTPASGKSGVIVARHDRNGVVTTYGYF